MLLRSLQLDDNGLGKSTLLARPAIERSRETIEIALGIIAAETWPPRYKMHKYWGRKPANVVSRYVDFFTQPGDIVLDPFAGSGVSVLEAVRMGRQGVGFDLNPFAVRLCQALLHPPDPHEFRRFEEQVIEEAHRTYGHLYRTECAHCGKDASLRSVGYVVDEPHEVRFRCDHCGSSGVRRPDHTDLAMLRQQIAAPDGAPDGEILLGWEMQKLKRRGVRYWRELFTSRNFATAAGLRANILKVEEERSREWLLLTLTAALAQFTRMIADFAGEAGGPSWKINCYWLPDRWQELNPLWYFQNRAGKSLDAMLDLLDAGISHQTGPFGRNGGQGPAKLRANGVVNIADSRQLPLQASSVDYIFTDPPYGGEGIQYGELSMLWCLWLGETEELEREVAYNPYRRLDQAQYAQGLHDVFGECFRVLKPSKWMTVTFANKDPAVWDALMDACKAAGFILHAAAPMKRSAPSLTETTMRAAPKADLVLSFQKPSGDRSASGVRTQRHAEAYSVDEAVARIAGALAQRGMQVTAHDVFDRVTVDWFSWFYENGARPSAVQPTLARIEDVLRKPPASS